MPTYNIKTYTKEKAKTLGVQVVPSMRKGKKIAVMKDGKVLAHIGQYGALDYPTYIEERGMEYAKKRRSLYRQRHKGENLKMNSPGYFAWHLLW